MLRINLLILLGASLLLASCSDLEELSENLAGGTYEDGDLVEKTPNTNFQVTKNDDVNDIKVSVPNQPSRAPIASDGNTNGIDIESITVTQTETDVVFTLNLASSAPETVPPGLHWMYRVYVTDTPDQARTCAFTIDHRPNGLTTNGYTPNNNSAYTCPKPRNVANVSSNMVMSIPRQSVLTSESIGFYADVVRWDDDETVNDPFDQMSYGQPLLLPSLYD